MGVNKINLVELTAEHVILEFVTADMRCLVKLDKDNARRLNELLEHLNEDTTYQWRE